MECYEGATMIKTFRGKLASSAQEIILLHTNDGSMGYRITKFQVMPASPGSTSYENVVKIYKVSQTTADIQLGAIDFSDQTLLATGYLEGNASNQYSDAVQVIFDKEIFNQDIYVTNFDEDGDTEAINFYIELEQVSLDINANTVATLKDMRNTASPRP
jgi:hypothetical protein